MNTTFIILMLLSCCAVIATFMSFTSAMYYRRYKDNGAYRLDMQKYVRVTVVLLVVSIMLSGATVLAATNCPECNAIAMHSYCERCGATVEANMHTCTQCGRDAYNAFCGYCGASQGG